MRFVHPKTIGQQGLQALHRVRQRRIHHRTALVNQIRGLLMEYGSRCPSRWRRFDGGCHFSWTMSTSSSPVWDGSFSRTSIAN
jgi:hypothetical protein